MKQTQNSLQREKEKTLAINYVHKNQIHNENIGKERKYETKNFKYEFTFSGHNRTESLKKFTFSISFYRKAD